MKAPIVSLPLEQPLTCHSQRPRHIHPTTLCQAVSSVQCSPLACDFMRSCVSCDRSAHEILAPIHHFSVILGPGACSQCYVSQFAPTIFSYTSMAQRVHEHRISGPNIYSFKTYLQFSCYQTEELTLLCFMNTFIQDPAQHMNVEDAGACSSNQRGSHTSTRWAIACVPRSDNVPRNDWALYKCNLPLAVQQRSFSTFAP